MEKIGQVVRETFSQFTDIRSLVIHDDLGYFGAGGRVARQSEIYRVSVNEVDYAWKRWAPNISEENILLQLEAINYLADHGIPIPRSIPSLGNLFLIKLADGSRCSVFEYQRGSYYTGTIEEQCSALALQTSFIATLRGVSFQHESGAQLMITPASILADIESIKKLEYNPETKTHLDEVKRIKERELPRLSAIVNQLSPVIQVGEISWIHADFHQRNLSFNPDGTVCAVYDLDFLHRDYVAMDIGHILDMFVLHSAEPGYHEAAPANYYRTMPFVLDVERLKFLVDKIRNLRVIETREISSLRSHIAMFGISKLLFLYRQGIAGPLGRRLLAREFMFQRKLDWTLTDVPQIKAIFGEN